MFGETGGAAQLDVLGRPEPRERDPHIAVSAELPHQFQPAAVRQLDVADEQVELGFATSAEGARLLAVWTLFPRRVSIWDR